MKNLIITFSNELKKFSYKVNLFIVIVCLILVLGYTQLGINEHNQLPDKIEKFKRIQNTMFDRAPHYEAYSRDGITIFYYQSALGAVFRHSILPLDTTAKIDSIVKVHLANNLKGKFLRENKKKMKIDVNGLLVFPIGLLCVLYGFEITNRKKYQQFLSTLMPPKLHFFNIVISRLIIIALYVFSIYASIAVLMSLNGINLISADYFCLLTMVIASTLMLYFFFFIGLIFSSFKKKPAAIIVLTIIWFTCSYIVPELFDMMQVGSIPDSIEDYEAELEKYKIITDFEISSVNKYGQFNRDDIKTGRKVIEGYWQDDYIKIEGAESDLKKRISRYIDSYHSISIFSPITFFQSTGDEVSSRGYQGFLELYNYAQLAKKNFLRFYFDRTYYSDHTKMVNFIKGDENIFRAKSVLPPNYWTGVFINLGYIILLSIVANFRFKKYLLSIDTRYKKLNDKNKALQFEKGKSMVYGIMQSVGLNEKLYLTLSGHSLEDEHLPVTIDGKPLDEHSGKQDFAYICSPEDLPGDITGASFILLVAGILNLEKSEIDTIKTNLDAEILTNRIEDMTIDEKSELLFGILPYIKNKIVFIDKTPDEISFQSIVLLKSAIESLTKQGSAVIHLTRNAEYTSDTIIASTKADFWDLRFWSELVTNLEQHKKNIDSEPDK